MEIILFSHEFSSKRMYRLELDSLVITRWSADLICSILRLGLYCVIAAHAHMDVINYVTHRIFNTN